jgi:predicted Zn finger-like uncharacterized protein
MILTCPECATSYFVDDGRIPPAGRKVKCSSCGHYWIATPEAPAAGEAPPAHAPREADPPPAAPQPQAESPPEEEVAAAPAEPPEAEPPAPSIRRRASPTRRPPEPRSNALVWAGVAALAAALIAGVIVFRMQVVRLWPASSAAYAGLGLAVDGGGLVLEQVQVAPTFVDGRPVLSVTGAIRNVRGEPAEAPPVRVTLLNRAGKPVAAKIARPVEATVPPRALRRFAIAITDPPANARDLEVRFVTGREAKAAPRAAEAVLATPASPAPEPAPAVPLPPPAAPEHG